MQLQTVTGLCDTGSILLADAHAHVWIAPPAGIAPDVRFELADEARIVAEFRGFRAAGGSLLVDCQPGGAGRVADKLSQLSQMTGVTVAAVTGFHLRKYYAPDHWLWQTSEQAASQYFSDELTEGMRDSSSRVRASLIKIGFDGSFDGQTGVLMRAAAHAARVAHVPILFHTEAGRNVDTLIPFFEANGVRPEQLYICHVDKRPDLGLHRELAHAGVLLGYDTFGRPKYDPDRNVWPLMHAMLDAGLDGSIAIGLDFASSVNWQQYGGGPGLLMLPEVIIPRLKAEGVPNETIARLTARNIAEHLAIRQEAA